MVIAYLDFECPWCARAALELRERAVGTCFRHFPVGARHPRAHAAACAVEAAALQDAFWPMHDALFADQGRLEDPHLWERARALGLDVARFDADRRAPGTVARVRRDFHGGVRAGVLVTPTVVEHGPDGVTGALHGGDDARALLAQLPRT